jgi:hypothetical protein
MKLRLSLVDFRRAAFVGALLLLALSHGILVRAAAGAMSPAVAPAAVPAPAPALDPLPAPANLPVSGAELAAVAARIAGAKVSELHATPRMGVSPSPAICISSLTRPT